MRVGFLLVSLLPALLLGQNYSTRGELETLARYEMRMVGDTFSVNNTQMAWFARQAAKMVDQKLRPYRTYDTINTSAGVGSYSLNSDCYENGVVGVRMRIDSTQGKYEALRSMFSRDEGQSAANETRPYWYYQHGGYITFEPTPQKFWQIIVQYEARSRDFSASVDSTSDSLATIPPEHDDLIVDYIRYLIAKRLGLEGLADIILARWKTDVAEARALMQARPDPRISPEGERGP